MSLDFTKFQSNGNDFVILEDADLTTKQIEFICNRNFGVGCDQLIILHNINLCSAQVSMFNSNGSKTLQCANGIRCSAAYLYNKIYQQTQDESINNLCIHTSEQEVRCQVTPVDKLSSTNLTQKNNLALQFSFLQKTNLTPQEWLVNSSWNYFSYDFEKIGLDTKLYETLNGGVFPEALNIYFNNNNLGFGSVIYLGNPHLIFFVENLDNFNMEKLGQSFNQNPIFKNGINLTLAQLINRNKIYAKTYERGAGLTLSCGSACIALSIIANHKGLSNEEICIYTPGGWTQVQYGHTQVSSTTLVNKIFTGKIALC